MPHVPLGVSGKFRGKSARGLYGGSIEELDSAIGEVFAGLKALGLDDNTLVVFTSHIEALPTTQLFQLSNDPTESTDLAEKRPDMVKLLTNIADESRADLGDFTGPGGGARFFDEGPRWPLSASSKGMIGEAKLNVKSSSPNSVKSV